MGEAVLKIEGNESGSRAFCLIRRELMESITDLQAYIDSLTGVEQMRQLPTERCERRRTSVLFSRC